MGLFTEANFLADSGFDYHRLAFVEATCNDGGPRAYLISALPTLLALLMKAAPSTQFVLIVCHLCTLACASVAIITLFALLKSLVGALPAGAAALSMATSPLFSTQCDMLSIDMPMTMAAVLTIWLAARRRLMLASVAAAAAFACKPGGLIVTAVLVAYELLLLVACWLQIGWRSRAIWSIAAAALWTAVLFAAQLAVYRWSNLGDRLQELAQASGYVSAVIVLCPDQLFVFLLGVAGTVAAVIGGLIRLRAPNAGADRDVERSLALDRTLLVIASWLLVAATVASIVIYVRVYSVRYLLLALPFLYAIVAVTVLRRLPGRVLVVVTLAAVSFNLTNWYGLFFPRVTDYRRHCSALERSHEYLADHRSNIAAMRELEANHSHDLIVAGFPFPYFLSYPRLGYVSRPLAGYSINLFSGERFPPVSRLFDDLPQRLTFIRVDNPNYAHGAITVPSAGNGDELLYDDCQKSPLVIFRTGLLPDGRPSRTSWLLKHLWLGTINTESDAALLLLRARWLSADHPAEALELIEMTDLADSFDGQILRGQLLLRIGRAREGAAAFAAATTLRPQAVEARVYFGEACLAAGDLQKARLSFDEAIRLDPRLAGPWQRLGMLSLHSREFADAVAKLRHAIALDAGDPDSYNALGIALANQEDWQAAREAFARAVDLAPQVSELRQNLAEADRMLQKTAPASGSDTGR
ncbi:MAG: tetratricopeptide repeat protein [Pirellulales bacterium]